MREIMGMGGINMDFVSKEVSQKDRKLFGMEDDCQEFDPETFTFADMAVSLGLFASRNQAHKNGWPKEKLPQGFGSRNVKNKKVRRDIFWLNNLSGIREDILVSVAPHKEVFCEVLSSERKNEALALTPDFEEITIRRSLGAWKRG